MLILKASESIVNAEIAYGICRLFSAFALEQLAISFPRKNVLHFFENYGICGLPYPRHVVGKELFAQSAFSAHKKKVRSFPSQTRMLQTFQLISAQSLFSIN